MNRLPRDSDGSDSFEADSMMEDPIPSPSTTTIRIPNPKVFLARQSQWKGRRGKPRCDYCRTNNLKCDREQPICNHCSWSSLSDCKYTPLPTPAHRGIPRCDRCRLRNLKCDRNLPICNNCSDGDGSECNYTPKKRHKVPVDSGVGTSNHKEQPISYGSKTAAFLVSDMGSSNFAVTEAVFQDPAHMKLKQRMSPNGPVASGSIHYQGDSLVQPDADVSPYYRSTSRPSDDPTWIRQYASAPNSRSRTVTNEKTIEPWVHQSFCPLPYSIVKVIRSLNALELPNRVLFDDALKVFLDSLARPLRETAAFSPPDYHKLAQAIESRNLSGMSARMKMWITCHHLRHGSRKQALILVPKDSHFSASVEEDEQQRVMYEKKVEGSGTGIVLEGGDTLSEPLAFDRLPIQPQIYELLAYSHRTHDSATFMISEMRRIGFTGITWPMAEIFARLCPVCRKKGEIST